MVNFFKLIDSVLKPINIKI